MRALKFGEFNNTTGTESPVKVWNVCKFVWWLFYADVIAGCWDTWQDGRSSSEVVEMCKVEDLSVKLRQRRLRWFGHTKRAEGGVLGEAREVRVRGRQLARGPTKKCDGGCELVGSGGACGTGSTDVESSHCLSNPILDGKMQTLNKNDDC